MVTPRILDRRRHPAAGRTGQPRRRRRSTRTVLGLTSAAAERLRLSTFGRIYFTATVVIALGMAYLLLAAQVTQSSYELNRLRADQAQLRAEQDQLKLKQASLRTPARVDQAAGAAGLQRGTSAEHVGYQPVAINLGAAIDQSPSAEQPGWQRALAALLNGLASTREAAAAER